DKELHLARLSIKVKRKKKSEAIIDKELLKNGIRKSDEYENLSNKKQFIENFQKKWVNKTTIESIAQKLSCSVDQVLEMRCKYFLLENHIAKTDINNRSGLKYDFTIYHKVESLYNLIRSKFVEFPFYTSFFSGQYGNELRKKLDSLIEWFKFGKEYNQVEFDVFINDRQVNEINTKAYPVVNFKNLPKRIQDLNKELLNIINNTVSSYYRERLIEIINNVGVRKAKTPIIQYNTFIEIQPGYYRPKGHNIIADILQQIYLKPNSNVITKESCSPLSQIDYLFEVLVPETAVHLIMNDIKCTYEEAKKVIVQSIEYRNCINSEADEIIESD
ncbi:7485_t:CDS:2, partial [Racocetra persica]